MTDHDQSSSPISLVSSLDVPILPVRPVKKVSQQTESKRMRKIIVSHNLSIGSINASFLNPVQLGVTPINILVFTIEG